MQFSPVPQDRTLAWLTASEMIAFPLLMEKSQEETGLQADRRRDAVRVVIREAPLA